MPLQKLKLNPGINREGTSLANEGGWFDGDKIRFRSGHVEKIGGWTVLSYDKFLGTCRSLWNWITLKQYNLMGIGTNLKFYIEDGGAYYDVTPIREQTLNSTTFSAVTIAPYSNIITVTDTNANDFNPGDFVTFTNAVSLGGNITAAVLNQEYEILAVTGATSYTISARAAVPGNLATTNGGATVLSNASDVGTGGANTDSAYQLNVSFDTATTGTGWGAGPWNAGSAADPWAHGWGTGYTSGFALQLRLWSQSNFGQELLFSPRGQALYVWDPKNGAIPDYASRALLVSGVDVPAFINQIMVSDSTRIVIAFGCNDVGVYGSTPLDPLLIRWTTPEDYSDWTSTATNQAGSYRLSHGSEIVTAFQTRQEIVVWTDAAAYSMQYLGPPFIWGFTLLADNISIISPNAVSSASGVVFWMGTDKFYVYAGRIETLPCTLRQYVFKDINTEQSAQFFSGTNEGFSEIWWFYCSAGSSVIDKYVIYNYLERVWYYGTMGRTAWLDSPLRTYPQAATLSNTIVFHETGVDDGETNPPSPITSYVQSSDFDIGDGDRYAFITQIVPDVSFDGSTTPTPNKPSLTFTMLPRQNPGARYEVAPSPTITTPLSYNTAHSYKVQEFTEIVYTRVRGREMSFRIDCNTLGTQWQLGVPSLNMRQDGRK